MFLKVLESLLLNRTKSIAEYQAEGYKESFQKEKKGVPGARDLIY
jgi:hypothetical protein